MVKIEIYPDQIQTGYAVNYLYGKSMTDDLHIIRTWIHQGINNHYQINQPIQVQVQEGEAIVDREDKIPMMIASFLMFALFLHAFQLYLSTTAEEREKRQMLGLILAPVTPGQILTAKAMFYGTLAVIVNAIIVAIYLPSLLIEPLFWYTSILGSIGFISLATLCFIIVKKQASINSVPMMYLLTFSVILILSKILWPFRLLAIFFIENYLINLFHLLVANDFDSRNLIHIAYCIGLFFFVMFWTVIAIYAFKRKSMDVSRPY